MGELMLRHQLRGLNPRVSDLGTNIQISNKFPETNADAASTGATVLWEGKRK